MFCRRCGEENDNNAFRCVRCGEVLQNIDQPPVPVITTDDETLIRMVIPIGRSGWAIAAGYLGLISVLFIPAPVALLVGIIAIRDIKKHPEHKGIGRAIFGVFMGAIFTATLILVLMMRY